MTWKVLIAHAEGEEALADKLAEPLRDAGYEVAHRGTVMVGESVVEEASRVLSTGGPVVLCGTVKAVGTGWAHRFVNAARRNQQVRVFAVQMEKDAYVQMLSLDGTVALYWQDPAKAVEDLIASLEKYYPLEADSDYVPFGYDAEQRYRELALESCDIIDLANLPESDRHIATRQLELRRLYVPLRVRVEVASDVEASEAEFEALEKRRGTSLPMGPGDRGEQEDERVRVPVGQRLAEARRLVVLGDPGAGKTTMVRWIATAYLLRLKQDPDWKNLPDVATLPDKDWLPVIVRCRDLNPSCLGGPLDNILLHTLRKAEMTDAESAALQAVLREKLRQGQALLLLDGLDEIANPAVRTGFCRQLEQIHLAYRDATIIATSRIVGYREMGYRLGRGFEHVTIADLSKEDKDDFARRWCAVTEPPERRERATEELIHDIHSIDRIERLTGNPMLLTTLALVKRKVGKLPSHRADLYWEGVQVLLNWRSEVDEPIDRYEAIPQLEYVAYEMCDRGVQQLREDEIIGLFERMREEYPRVHAVRRHRPEEFLRLLERRTGILVEAGHVRHRGRPVPVFEFRHLTFQEYLASLSLVDGRFPGRDRSRSLADHVAPLAGRTSEVEEPRFGEREVTVTENWREALRLCVASCNDDDVDDVLLAILNPLEGEDAGVTARPRAVLAALCLADEPNASEETVQAVLWAFVGQVDENDGTGNIRTGIDAAAMELATSRWAERLRSLLISEFRRQDTAAGKGVCGLCGMVAESSAPQDEVSLGEWLTAQVTRL
ncbi:MAG: NACHT domain-containing protein, partial [Anaerolineae bacterium]|nr:NACHT domain-containing protein [Anaerolineae bacterium]